ncbi:unnamed protein product [Paramecium primaurelia]|uniref:Uncharacterized protein n=1 Tax=Paramecium primaurelia TaxID=5886 RepID=A0A8S1L8Y8_PARPR|nr:unnamed protein product [Paramecium primaurelia]
MKRKHTLFLRKVVGEQSQMSWPFADQDLHSSNIFQTQSPDYQIFDFSQKNSTNEILSRSIVGKLDIYNKQVNGLEKPLRFSQPVKLSSMIKKIKRTNTNEPSSLNSSYRSKKNITNQQQLIQKTGDANFEVLDKYELLQTMEKIQKIIKNNEKNAQNQLQKISVTEKILKNQHERALNKHEKQLQIWNELSTKISSRMKNNQSTLIERQAQYRSRLDSLDMFEELKPEESKNPVITWHQRLRSQYRPQKIIQKEEQERLQLKQDLLEQIPSRELLDIPNPQKLISDIKNKNGYDKGRSVSDYNGLKLVGLSVYDQELNSLKKDQSQIQYEGEPKDQTDYFLGQDPDVNLSEKGQNQANQTGMALKQIINEHISSQKLNTKDLIFVFMSSHYMRCIETLAIVMQYLPTENKKIYIQNQLSDLLLPHLYKQEPVKEQFQINYDKKIQGYFNKKYGVEIWKQNYIKGIKIEQKYPEDQTYCRARIGSFIIETQNYVNGFQNKANYIYICATHLGVQEIVLDHFDGKCKNIDYCSVTTICFPENWQNPKLTLKAKTLWK